MLFQLDQTGGAVSEDSILFEGDFDFARDGQAWEAAFYESGTLRFAADPGICDIWILDGGEDGGSGEIAGGYVYSGIGGDGGLHKLHTVRLRRGVEYTLTVGAAGEASSLAGGGLDLDASAGTRSAGGTKAKMPQGVVSQGDVNSGGNQGAWPYESDSVCTLIVALAGKRLGASGAGGDANNDSGVYTDQHSSSTTGGEHGGGDGAVRDHHNGYDATQPGGGGGGGYGDGKYGQHGVGGSGASGLILVRKHVEVAA